MRFLGALLGIFLAASPAIAQDALKTILIDTDTKESLCSLRVDSTGRLFVAGRAALFVYEPNEQGGYLPRKRLCKFPESCRISDIELRGKDVYVLTLNALYVLPDALSTRQPLPLKKLLWGVPLGKLRQGLHALTWGPQGDLFLAMGDALGDYGDAGRPDHWGHWTFFGQPEGTKIPYSGVGAIFRCKPDGSDFTIVAGGLRNPRGLVFDRYWDLFSSEQCGELLPITPHAYYSFPRGLKADNMPWRADLLPPMLECAAGPAPARLSYYDETLLPQKYRQRLLAARDAKIMRTAIVPHGAGFKAEEFTFWEGNKHVQPRGVTVGRGGRIFAILAYRAPPEKTELVMLTKADDPAAHPFEPYEATEATPVKLWQELSDPSWQRRYRAHLEIVRRGGKLLEEANKRLLTAKADDPALHSLIWLAALSRRSSLHLIALVDAADPRVRVQVLRALAEFPEQLLGEPLFAKFLLDDNPTVLHAAVLAYFGPKNVWSQPIRKTIERGPACSKDPYLRQAAALLLAEKLTRQQIEDLCGRFDAPLRLAGVLAAGYRLTLRGAMKPLAPHLPLAKPREEEACFFEDADGKVDLRKRGRVGQFTVAEHWKADIQTVEQNLLFKLLRKMLDDPDAPTRLQAAYFLSLLKDERTEPEVQRVFEKFQMLKSKSQTKSNPQ